MFTQFSHQTTRARGIAEIGTLCFLHHSGEWLQKGGVCASECVCCQKVAVYSAAKPVVKCLEKKIKQELSSVVFALKESNTRPPSVEAINSAQTECQQ